MPDLDARLLSEAAFYDSVYATSRFADRDLVVRADEPPVPHCGMAYIVDEMLRLAGPLEGKRVLEIGCGGGLFSTYFALRGAQVTGIDVSEAALSVARRRAALSVPDGASLPQFLNVPAEMLAQKFAARSFDVVFGFAVAHHFDQTLFPRAVESVLVVGGTLLLYEPTPHSTFLHPPILRAHSPSARQSQARSSAMSQRLMTQRVSKESTKRGKPLSHGETCLLRAVENSFACLVSSCVRTSSRLAASSPSKPESSSQKVTVKCRK